MTDLNALQALLTATESLTDEERRDIYTYSSEHHALSPEHAELLRSATRDQTLGLIAEFDETDAGEKKLEEEATVARAELEPVSAALTKETLEGINAAKAAHSRALGDIERGLDAEVGAIVAKQDAAAADAIREQLKKKDS